MALDNMRVFDEYVMPATIETLGQMIEKFNAQSNGSLRLTTQGFDGNFYQESFYAAIHNAQRRVSMDGANSAVASTDLTQREHTGVKVAGGFGPIIFEPEQFAWLQKPTAEGIEVASRNFAEALLADQLNTAIACSVAAIGNQADLVNDVSAEGKVTHQALNSGHALFGDASSRIVANIMNGATFHELIGQNLNNVEQLFVAGNVQVVDLLGRAIIVTDAPALFDSVGGKNHVLGLVDGAANIWDAGQVISNIDTVNGKSRIESSLQLSYRFGVALKGYSWDKVNGGSSPDDQALATGSNWDLVMTSKKDTAGVLIKGAA